MMTSHPLKKNKADRPRFKTWTNLYKSSLGCSWSCQKAKYYTLIYQTDRFAFIELYFRISFEKEEVVRNATLKTPITALFRRDLRVKSDGLKKLTS